LYLVDLENKLEKASSSGVPYIIVGGKKTLWKQREF
jgi:hypothetical protein